MHAQHDRTAVWAFALGLLGCQASREYGSQMQDPGVLQIRVGAWDLPFAGGYVQYKLVFAGTGLFFCFLIFFFECRVFIQLLY